MKFATKMTSGIAAAGAAALAGGLFVVSPGVGAVFTDSARADVNVEVGTFGCEFLDPDTNTNDVIVGNAGNATITLDTIQSSAPSHQTGRVKVKNTGTMPLYASFNGQRTAGSSHFHAMSIPSVVVPANASRSVYLGIKWDELDNNDLGRTASVKYTMSCNDALAVEAGFSIYEWVNPATDQSTSKSSFDGTTLKLWIPLNRGGMDGGGTGINLIDPPTTLPSGEPTLVTDNWNESAHPGSLRWTIDFSDGTYIRGAQSPGMGYWDAVNTDAPSVWVPSGHLDWSQVYSHYKNIDVTHVQVTMGNDWSGVPANITCVNYSGTPLFGSC